MKNIIVVIVCAVISTFIISCSSGPTITKITTLDPLSEVDAKITKNGVTIEVMPVYKENLIKFPMLSKETKVNESKHTFSNILGCCDKGTFSEYDKSSRLSFSILITNNTGHTIKLGGSDYVLSINGKDIKKLSKDDLILKWKKYLKEEYRLDKGVPNEILQSLNSLNFWTEDVKVLPGKNVQVFTTFDIAVKEGLGQLTFAIYDLVTNTDQAGNPTERTNFDFNFKETTKQVMSN